MDIIRTDFKSGLEALLKAKPVRAIFLGVRIGDPTAVFFTILRKLLLCAARLSSIFLCVLPFVFFLL